MNFRLLFCRERYGEVEKLTTFYCKFTTASRKQIFQWIVVNLRFFFTVYTASNASSTPAGVKLAAIGSADGVKLRHPDCRERHGSPRTCQARLTDPLAPQHPTPTFPCALGSRGEAEESKSLRSLRSLWGGSPTVEERLEGDRTLQK